MKLIVGLGNPGSKYENTRHNIGFMMIDKFANVHNLSFKEKFEGLYCKTNILSEEVIFLKPQTFMNLSGTSVKGICDFFKISSDDILLIYDDLDMNFSKIKIKINSSAGGHNGVKDIINKLHTQDILRIKFGILNEYKKDTKDFVLSKFSKMELKEIEQKYNVIENIIFDFIKTEKEEYNKIVSTYN